MASGARVGRLLGVLTVLGACALARADILSPEQFTDRFARALQSAVPATTVAVVRPLQLTVRRNDGTSATVNLANVYRDAGGDASRFEDHVKAYATALASRASGKLDRARIVPVVKDRAWLAETQQLFRSRQDGQEPVFDEFNKELVVVYVEDSPGRMRYLWSAEDLGVARADLRALAVKNLLRILPKIERRQHDDAFSIISAGGDYEASLLLVDDIWSSGEIKVEGDIVVAVPARDVLLVTGSRSRKGLKAVRAMAAELAKGQYRLTETLFVYRNGKFVKFGRN
jgi:uncharacterized protein YtpQ (UPF0354 family)